MNYIGISNGFHDAGMSVIGSSGNILFAGHSERYSKNKHDSELSIGLIEDVLKYTTDDFELHYYEKPILKILRQLRAGQRLSISNLSDKQLIGAGYYSMLGKKSIKKHSHHLSHAAAGFQTSPFNDATVVVVDAIGEFDTISIWDAYYDNEGKAKYKKLFSKIGRASCRERG